MMMTDIMRAVLVDDEPLALRGLQLRLAPFADVEVVAHCNTGREAVTAVLEHEPDILFLDISMPGMDGFSVLNAVRMTDEKPMVVFVTAFNEFAVRAFEANAFDYILKPIEESRLAQVVDRLRQRRRQRSQARYGDRIQSLLSTLQEWPAAERSNVLLRTLSNVEAGYTSTLAIRDRGRVARVAVDDIDWIEADRDYMRIHAGGQNFLMRETMLRLEEKLNPSQFLRVHRSALVNVTRARELRTGAHGTLTIVLKNGDEIPVGRSYRRKVAGNFEQMAS